MIKDNLKNRDITPNLLSLFCEKNSDGTKVLRLKGNELQRRIGKRITNDKMPIIVEFLKENDNVVNLQLPYNKIGDDGFLILCREILGQENKIAHLNLTGNDITREGIVSLNNCQPTLVLKTLRLAANPIGNYGGYLIGNLLFNTNTIEYLDIGDTHQDLESIPILCAALRSDLNNKTTLKVLDLSNVIQSGFVYQLNTLVLAEEIEEMLKNNSTLHELHLQKCSLLGHDVEILLKGLRKNDGLLMLDLGYNQIGNYGGELLGEWLKTKPRLTGLNIAGNGIGECGALSLAVGLSFSNIRLLDLSMNKITDEALELLMMAIKKKVSILLLFLWGNQLGPKVLKVIERQIKAGVFSQKNIDVLVYKVDDELQAAFYPCNNYKRNYYCLLEPEDVRDLKIKKNKIPDRSLDDTKRINFVFYDKVDRNEKYRSAECESKENRIKK